MQKTAVKKATLFQSRTARPPSVILRTRADFCGSTGDLSIFAIGNHLPSQRIRSKWNQALGPWMILARKIALGSLAIVFLSLLVPQTEILISSVTGRHLFILKFVINLIFVIVAILAIPWTVTLSIIFRRAHYIAITCEGAYAREDSIIDDLRRWFTTGRLGREAQRAKIQSNVFESAAAYRRTLSVAFIGLTAFLALPSTTLSLLLGSYKIPDVVRFVPPFGALICLVGSLFYSERARALIRVQFLLEQAQLTAVDLDTPPELQMS